METKRKAEIIELIKQEVKPALGCTEPIAVSLAVAKSTEILKDKGFDVEIVEVSVSANILKNGMGVGVPGTGMVGLNIAAALGVTCGKSKYKLEVLKDLTEETLAKAKAMLDNKKVSVGLAETNKKLYVLAKCIAGDHSAITIIEDNHDNITKTEFDGKLIGISENQNKGSAEKKDVVRDTLEYALDVKVIYQFIKEVDFEDVEFILDAVTLNRALAMEGLKNHYGLEVGRKIQDSKHEDIFGKSFHTYAMALTAAASDARMDGCTLPAMSNSGSGNQGITVTMPVIAAAEWFKSSTEELARALTLSHLIAIHIKSHLGRLSALCGCVIASTGAACGIVYLRGGGYEQICYAIKNMVGNITGMICDGAKVGCALKVASGVSSAVQAAVLALDNICISANDGIIEEDIEKTIQNLGAIGSEGMRKVDAMILDIMVRK